MLSDRDIREAFIAGWRAKVKLTNVASMLALAIALGGLLTWCLTWMGPVNPVARGAAGFLALGALLAWRWLRLEGLDAVHKALDMMHPEHGVPALDLPSTGDLVVGYLDEIDEYLEGKRGFDPYSAVNTSIPDGPGGLVMRQDIVAARLVSVADAYQVMRERDRIAAQLIANDLRVVLGAYATLDGQDAQAGQVDAAAGARVREACRRVTERMLVMRDQSWAFAQRLYLSVDAHERLRGDFRHPLGTHGETGSDGLAMSRDEAAERAAEQRARRLHELLGSLGNQYEDAEAPLRELVALIGIPCHAPRPWEMPERAVKMPGEPSGGEIEKH